MLHWAQIEGPGEVDGVVLLPEVEAFVRRHRLFRPGDRVIAAVSGGPDSVALLHVLRRMQDGWRLNLHVVHVDHGLRPDAAKDAAFVARLADGWGIPYSIESVDVKARRRGGESIQQAARRLRLGALRKRARAVDGDVIALGHHRDDQAETVLLRLLRGTGTAGLGGMRPKRGPFVRPLLDVSRADIETYCAAHGLEAVHDPSNLSDQYVRNRIRRRLLPLLRDEYNRNIVERLARTGELLQADDEYLETLANAAYEGVLLSRGGKDGDEGPVRLRVDKLRRQPLPLQRRIVRRALKDAGADIARVTYDHTDVVTALAEEGAAGAVVVPGRIRVDRVDGELWFGPLSRDAALAMDGMPGGAVVIPEPLRAGEIQIPGRTLLARGIVVDVAWEGAAPLDDGERTGETEDASQGDSDGTDQSTQAADAGEGRLLSEARLDGAALHFPLFVRTRRPGDRMRPLGLGGSKKLQDLFVDEKVPRYFRDRVPVLCDQEGIVWIPGLRLDERAALSPHSRHVLHIAVKSL